MDYEKAYKEILEKAKIFRQKWEGIEINSELALKELKEIFPELSESKDESNDERVRKFLIKTIQQVPNDSLLWETMDKSSVLTWLEKPIPKFRVGDTICMISEEVPYPRTIEKIENGNYIYDNGKGSISLEFQDNYELLKQEPILNQSSAEKLMLMKKCVHLAFKRGYKSGLQTANAEWEHKTTWSEEDTIRLNQAVYALHQQGYSDVENWLKSLNPQKINVEQCKNN